jgi:hypothetical protein
VTDVRVQLGTEVRAGDVIARLEPRELQLALDRAESALRQVEAQLGIDHLQQKQAPADDQIASMRQATANRDDARNAFERAQQLSGRGLLTQADRDSAETRLKIAEANYQATLDTVHSLKASLQDRRASYELAQKVADAVIRAPVAGSISERLIQPRAIRENVPVATIVRSTRSSSRPRSRRSTPASSPPGRRSSSTSRRSESQVHRPHRLRQPRRRSGDADLRRRSARRQHRPHAEAGLLRQGVVLTRVDQNVLAVPEEAISTLAGVSTVYVIEGGKARAQQVTLGARKDKLVEITSGLKGDESLATTNLSQLATGVTVRVGTHGDELASETGRGAAEGGRRGARP